MDWHLDASALDAVLRGAENAPQPPLHPLRRRDDRNYPERAAIASSPCHEGQGDFSRFKKAPNLASKGGRLWSDSAALSLFGRRSSPYSLLHPSAARRLPL